MRRGHDEAAYRDPIELEKRIHDQKLVSVGAAQPKLLEASAATLCTALWNVNRLRIVQEESSDGVEVRLRGARHRGAGERAGTRGLDLN